MEDTVVQYRPQQNRIGHSSSVNQQPEDSNSQSPQENTRAGENEEEENTDDFLRKGAKRALLIIIPISICALVVIATISSVSYYTENHGVYLVYTPFHEEGDISGGEKFGQAVLNALIVVGVVLGMTIILVLLYKYRFYKIIYGVLFIGLLLICSVIGSIYFSELLKTHNIAMDYITFAMIIWNYAVVGMICIFWKGPLLLQQIYLIFTSALMALVFIKYLPDWTVWVLLAAISIYGKGKFEKPSEYTNSSSNSKMQTIVIAALHTGTYFLELFSLVWSEVSWKIFVKKASRVFLMSQLAVGINLLEDDLVAVLPKFGPLRILVEIAQQRNEDIFPSLIYSSTVMYYTVIGTRENKDIEAVSLTQSLNDRESQEQELGEDNPTLAQDHEERHQEAARALNGDHDQSSERLQENTTDTDISREEEEERGVKLGLGDFIFYSVLVGKASSKQDWNTTIACLVAILIGFALTLLLLAIYRKALPALPISITFGLIFYFATSYFVKPFTELLAMEQVFI